MLVVDDDPDFLYLASRFLEKVPGVKLAGVVVKGKQALPQVQALQPDIVLVDLNMPDLPGLDVISLLRAEKAQLSIIALTGIDDAQQREGALAVGADAYVLKDNMDRDLVPSMLMAIQRHLGQQKNKLCDAFPQY